MPMAVTTNIAQPQEYLLPSDDVYVSVSDLDKIDISSINSPPRLRIFIDPLNREYTKTSADYICGR